MDAADPTIQKYLVELNDIDYESEDSISESIGVRSKLSNDEQETLDPDHRDKECEETIDEGAESVIFIRNDGDYYYQSAEAIVPVNPLDMANSYKKITTDLPKLYKNGKNSKATNTSTISKRKNLTPIISNQNTAIKTDYNKRKTLLPLRDNYIEKTKQQTVIASATRKETRLMSAEKKANSKQRQIIIEIDPKEYKEDNGKYSEKNFPQILI